MFKNDMVSVNKVKVTKQILLVNEENQRVRCDIYVVDEMILVSSLK